MQDKKDKFGVTTIDDKEILTINGKPINPELIPVIEAMADGHTSECKKQAADYESIQEGFMRNSKGWMIPLEQVEEKEIIEHELIDKSHRIMAAMQSASNAVSLYPYRSGRIMHHADMRRWRIREVRRATMSLSPEAHAAKELVMECIKRRSDNVDKLLLSLVDAAWKTDESGELSVSKVSSLFSVPCRDDDWVEAMDAVRAAMRGNGIKTYTRIYHRSTPNAKWELVEAKV